MTVHKGVLLKLVKFGLFIIRRQSTLKFINQTGLIRFFLQIISNSLSGFLEDRIPDILVLGFDTKNITIRVLDL